MLGYREQDILSRPFLDLVHPDDLNQTILALKEKGFWVYGADTDGKRLDKVDFTLPALVVNRIAGSACAADGGTAFSRGTPVQPLASAASITADRIAEDRSGAGRSMLRALL